MSFQIGWFHLEEDRGFVDRGYECAAWSQKIKVPAGKYPVTAEKFQFNERDRKMTNRLQDRNILVKLEGTITASDFTTHYGGVAIGSKIDTEVGKKTTHFLHYYAHALATEIIGGRSKVELLPEFEAREIHYEWDGEQKTTYGIFKKEEILGETE